MMCLGREYAQESVVNLYTNYFVAKFESGLFHIYHILSVYGMRFARYL